MTEALKEDPVSWQAILLRLRREVSLLGEEEHDWIEGRLEEIGRLQREMHGYFLRARGSELCRNCLGACCDLGKNHLLLANLLGYLLRGVEPPDPDFSLPCPFLGEGGCLHEVSRRPFNCVSFLCEKIEERLCSAEREAFYRLEGRLREIYGEFDRRFAGSSPRGSSSGRSASGSGPFYDTLE